jgi:hypothetical protein
MPVRAVAFQLSSIPPAAKAQKQAVMNAGAVVGNQIANRERKTLGEYALYR